MAKEQERDRTQCPQHGYMYFKRVRKTDHGAIHAYYCSQCDHKDTFEVTFAPQSQFITNPQQ